MGDRVWVQCAVCGKLHRVNKKDASMSDDDLYIELHCSRCRDSTKHLLIGQHKEDVYIYGDSFLDERYFI